MKLLFKKNVIKYTCACCGYKTLPSTCMGDTCCVCLWEEGYDDLDNLFCISTSNDISLFEAQENYKKFGCCEEKFILHSRMPNANESKDTRWFSIQDTIESNFDIEHTLSEMILLSEHLNQPHAKASFRNFKRLREIDILNSHNNTKRNHHEISSDTASMRDQLFFKSLATNLAKKDFNLLLNFFIDLYKNDISYYLSWAIILIVLVQFHQSSMNNRVVDIFLDLENSNYYGLESLKMALKQYWHNHEI
ncbi:MAG: CPCC family cysteine-rich protein [Gammaproteobacteria bacterium]|nr:CPCC family cysteine-rich protein [Gammaproteobacteria bacterium]